MYRPNICVVITNKKRSKVLMFHRIGAGKQGWQFPQGGVDPEETDKKALYRELEEEVGTNRIKVLKKSKKRIKYKFPHWVLEEFAKEEKTNRPQYKGQKQRWYLVRLKDGVASISFDYHPAEFDDFEWVSVQKSIQRIIPFKRKAYKKGLELLGMID